MLAFRDISSTNSKFTTNMMELLSIILAVFAVSPAFASIVCLKVGATATARWTNAADSNCTWTGTVGSNFGIDPVNGGKYVAVLRKGKIISY